MASHEAHLQELTHRWNALADEVAELKACWHALEGEHPGCLDPDYGSRLDELREHYIPRTLQQLDETPRTDAGLEDAFPLTRGHLDHTIELVTLPELSAELSVKEQSDVRTLHMRVLAAARNITQYIGQTQTAVPPTVIEQILSACGNRDTISGAQALINHLKRAKKKLEGEKPDPEEKPAAENLANDWERRSKTSRTPRRELPVTLPWYLPRRTSTCTYSLFSPVDYLRPSWGKEVVGDGKYRDS